MIPTQLLLLLFFSKNILCEPTFFGGVPQVLSNLIAPKSTTEDDFFKDFTEPTTPESILERKLKKIAAKLQFLGILGTSETTTVDNFDKEFEEFTNEDTGYIYEKPTVKNGKIQNDKNIAVFFAELFGSVMGLLYGAAAQLNPGGTPTTPP